MYVVQAVSRICRFVAVKPVPGSCERVTHVVPFQYKTAPFASRASASLPLGGGKYCTATIAGLLAGMVAISFGVRTGDVVALVMWQNRIRRLPAVALAEWTPTSPATM